MRKKIVRAAVVVILLLLPFIVRMVYVQLTSLPDVVALGSGPADGRYRQISEAIAAELRRRNPGMTVVVKESNGSLDNLRMLQKGEVDFALYQPGTEEILEGAAASEHDDIAFVANLYTEVAHFIVRDGSGIDHPGDLMPHHRVAIGKSASGDYAMSRVLLEHFGLTENDVDVRQLGYLDVEQGLKEGTLDATIITAGTRAPVFQRLFANGGCKLVDIPHTAALSQRRISITPHVIPAGLHRSHAPAVPEFDVQTVALRAQLLTRTGEHSGLVREVTRIVIGERFVREQQLSELYADGAAFAQGKPEFVPHRATAAVFDPSLRPILNPDFVEATEGMRSFVVSFLIAGYLVWHRVRRRRIRSQEHRLDRYIRKMLEIERRQLDLDQTEGSSDIKPLQDLLDELTSLRQEALSELTAHQLNEDQAADSFLEMAHALSDKINAKISRQRLDKQFDELKRAVREGSS